MFAELKIEHATAPVGKGRKYARSECIYLDGRNIDVARDKLNRMLIACACK